MSTRKKAIIALIIANIIWGAASPIFKWSLQNIGPFTLAFLRFSLGAFLLFPFTYKELNIAKKDVLSVFGIGFFGVFLNIVFFFFGLRLTESINAPIIASSGPILLILFSVFLLKEKLKQKVLTGTLVGLAGVLIIIFEPLLQNGIDGNVLGNFFLLLATLGAVGHAVISKKVLLKYNPLPVTFWSFLIGSLLFLPFFLNEVSSPSYLSGLNPQGIIGVVFGALFSSAIAYYLYEWGVKNINVSETCVFTYIDPVVAVVIAIPLLGERLTPIFIIGSLFVFAGILIAQGKLSYHYLLDLFKDNGIIKKINN